MLYPNLLPGGLHWQVGGERHQCIFPIGFSTHSMFNAIEANPHPAQQPVERCSAQMPAAELIEQVVEFKETIRGNLK